MDTLLDDKIKPDQPEKTERPSGNSENLPLPYASSVYYKGIFSIPLAISVAGFIYSIYLINIAITRGNEMKRLFKASPNKYAFADYEKVKKGMLCSYISVAILILEILAFLILF